MIERDWHSYLDGRLSVDGELVSALAPIEQGIGEWHDHLRRELRRFRNGERRLAGADEANLSRGASNS